ncbi:hypothetical protein CC86DRAFT_437443, partial [Ophiobolus disseminans]
MTELFDSLGAGNLVRDLQATLGVLEKINVSGAEPEVASLVEQVSDLVDIVQEFDSLATRERRHPSIHLKIRSPSALLHLRAVLDSTATLINECSPFVRPLRSSLESFIHERDAVGYLGTENHLENQAWYEETYSALRLLAELLRALFTATDLLQYQDIDDEDAQLLKDRSSTATKLHFQIELVEQKLHSNVEHDTFEVREALKAAKEVTVYIPPTPNQHFIVPRRVRAYYTGRIAQLATLEVAFRDPTLPTQQVFVIYGLSGSGKTELAVRFAEEYRHKFWGVFYVDGVAPNAKAAKHWLITRALPWLLLIDNVDEDRIRIRELLPQGSKGCCIITTRNPAHVEYGNTGDRYLELLPMEPQEAEDLLINAAEEPKPLATLIVDSARTICQALGYLPLALDQAAKAIRLGICNWAEYLVYFDRQIRRIRRNLHGRSNSRSREKEYVREDKHSIKVFSTYEILYESLQSSPNASYQDAIELLHVFSYFHFQNIRLDFLINSAVNPLKEMEQQGQDAKQMKEILEKLEKPPRTPWLMAFREVRAFVRMKLATPTPLPEVLRNRNWLNLNALEDEIHVRLREALGVLIERSLVMRQDRNSGQYSMHRLVHKWVRERPEMSTSHQALWCQVSMTTLAFSIRRPPHGDTENEARLRRELLPHIRHVCEHQTEIERRLQENSEQTSRLWLLKKSYGRLEAEQDVRFARVYGETGHFDEAQKLQERALTFVSTRLGADHPIAIGLSLLVSQSLWEMSEMDKAVQRQRRARQMCLDTWGEDHPLTLDVTDLLGSALYLKGRWLEAQSLHICNTEKFRTLYGAKHEKTLKSIRNTARLHYRWMDYDRATELYQVSWQGMKDIRGETHLETLFCLEDLAMSYVRLEEDENP